MTERSVPAANFVSTMSANVNNEKMSDAEFREFVRNTIPIVQTDDRWNDAIAACKREVSGYLNGRTNMGDHYGSYYASELNAYITRRLRQR